jgi:hypothetical protein
MRVLLACGMLVIAGARGAPPRPLSAHRPTAQPVQTAARRPGKSAPAALGGPAKYDAKKGAMLGGTVMPHRP